VRNSGNRSAETITRRAYLRRTPLKRKPRRTVVPPEVLAYWEWIRQQPCAVCGWAHRFICRVEAAHVGMRGLSQLCNGWEVIPLCQRHHGRGFPESHHVLGKRFWSFHNLDRYEVIREFQRRYFGLIGVEASRGLGSVRPGEAA
jgi:hypothetical protein